MPLEIACFGSRVKAVGRRCVPRLKATLLDALTLPVKALDVCAPPFLVAAANQAAVAVAPVAALVVAHEPHVVKGGYALWATPLNEYAT
eukprot:1279104-Pleurochrysis_carterae.AAC.2